MLPTFNPDGEIEMNDENEGISLPGQQDSSKFLKTSKVGRKPKPIDEEKLKEFLSVNMPITRIAHYFNCTPETLYNRYGDMIIEHNVEFEHMVRLNQVKAINGLNPTLLIWLGKQVLGQRDMQELTVTQEKPSVSEITFLPLRKED